jgi:hypothetical protein
MSEASVILLRVRLCLQVALKGETRGSDIAGALQRRCRFAGPPTSPPRISPNTTPHGVEAFRRAEGLVRHPNPSSYRAATGQLQSSLTHRNAVQPPLFMKGTDCCTHTLRLRRRRMTDDQDSWSAEWTAMHCQTTNRETSSAKR